MGGMLCVCVCVCVCGGGGGGGGGESNMRYHRAGNVFNRKFVLTNISPPIIHVQVLR